MFSAAERFGGSQVNVMDSAMLLDSAARSPLRDDDEHFSVESSDSESAGRSPSCEPAEGGGMINEAATAAES